MDLTKDNFDVYAAKHYTNERCLTIEEFKEDLKIHKNIKRYVKRVSSGKQTNIRAFINQIVLFTNNFEIEAARKLLTFGLNEEEIKVLNTIFLYLGFTKQGEPLKVDDKTALALKELDRWQT